MDTSVVIEIGVSLLTLTALEIVLGIDNIIFISILTGKLPPERRRSARTLGLAVAMGTRILLLLTISSIMKLTRTIFTIPANPILGEPHAFSWKDMVLLVGGLFLIVKSTKEIHHKVDGGESAAGTHPDPARALARVSVGAVIGQIMLVDIVFSLDSVITAVGMANQIWVMITAVILAVLVMMAIAGPISAFVERHPTVKMLALAFLILIGVMLVAESVGEHIGKGYIYFAMAFSLVVEALNIRASKRSRPAPPPAAP